MVVLVSSLVNQKTRLVVAPQAPCVGTMAIRRCVGKGCSSVEKLALIEQRDD